MTITQLPATWPDYAASFRIPEFCEDAMACVVNQYANGYDQPIPLPDRQYWTLGETAHDCEQMTLAVQQLFLGTSEFPLSTSQCNGPRSLTFGIEVIRCTPTMDNHGKPPAADAIEVSSVNPVIDMQILMDCGKCFDPYNAGIVITVDAIPANGGVHGCLATYTVTL